MVFCERSVPRRICGTFTNNRGNSMEAYSISGTKQLEHANIFGVCLRFYSVVEVIFSLFYINWLSYRGQAKFVSKFRSMLSLDIRAFLFEIPYDSCVIATVTHFGNAHFYRCSDNDLQSMTLSAACTARVPSRIPRIFNR